jgi:hypothetical protein
MPRPALCNANSGKGSVLLRIVASEKCVTGGKYARGVRLTGLPGTVAGALPPDCSVDNRLEMA